MLLPLVALAGVVLVLYHVAVTRNVVDDLHLNDFGKAYYSARMFLADQDLYSPSPATLVRFSPTDKRQLWNLNPPHFQLLLLPLAPLAPRTAYAVWAALSIVALLISMRLAWRVLDLRLTPLRLIAGIMGLLAFGGTGAMVATGQVSWILMLPVTVGWLEARRGRWSVAAAWLGLAASCKPFLLVFIVPLLLGGRARQAAVVLATVVACFAVGVGVFGIEAHRAWVARLLVVDWHWAAMNGSLMGLWARVLAPSPYFKPLVHAPRLILPLAGVGAVATLLASSRGARLSGPAAAIDRCFVVWVLAAQLASPLGWVYYLWLGLGPFLAWRCGWEEQTRGQRVAFWIGVVALFFPLPAIIDGQPSGFATLTLGSAYCWGTLALWVAAVSQRDRSAAPATR